METLHEDVPAFLHVPWT